MVGIHLINIETEKIELSDALNRGKAKGLQLATTKLMEKIQEGEFNAIQFYLKSADRETWAEKQTVEHNLNLAGILDSARERVNVIEHRPAQAPALGKRAQSFEQKRTRRASERGRGMNRQGLNAGLVFTLPF